MQYKENLLKVTQIAVDGPKDLQASPMQKIRVVWYLRNEMEHWRDEREKKEHYDINTKENPWSFLA